MDRFPQEIHGALKWYVYRLIDPRNGSTFYVGKGQGDRVFDHARGALDQEIEPNEEGIIDLKHDIIRNITKGGLRVLYVIHRHGIELEATAYHVEAALIDAYPGLSNLADGHGNTRYGCRSVEQIIAKYAAPPLIIKEPLILIYIGKTLDDRGSIYDAVRGVWKMAIDRAERHRLVLAYDGALVIGAYRPKRWMKASKADFPFMKQDNADKIGFEGTQADDVWKTYIGTRVPPRRRGDMSAFRYLAPTDEGAK